MSERKTEDTDQVGANLVLARPEEAFEVLEATFDSEDSALAVRHKKSPVLPLSSGLGMRENKGATKAIFQNG